MRNLTIVTKNIIKRMFRSPISFILHLLFPVVVSLGMFMLFSGQTTSKIPMALANQDDSRLSYAVVEAIERTGKFKIIKATDDQAQDMVAEGEASFAYIIKKGFEDTIVNGNSPKVEIVSLSENEGTGWMAAISDYAIQNIVDMTYAAGDDIVLLYQMVDHIKTGDIVLDVQWVEDVTVAKGASQSAIGMYILVLMISTFTIAFKVLQEKEMGTFARIGLSPVNPKIYTLANVVANMAVATFQIALVLTFLVLVGKINFFMSPFMMFLILWVFAICAVSLGLMLAAFAKRSEVAGTLLSLVLTPSCMLAGCFWSVDFMPKYLRRAAYITPQRWTLDAILNMQNGEGFQSIVPSLLIVLAFALLFFLVAAYRFKSADQRLG